MTAPTSKRSAAAGARRPPSTAGQPEPGRLAYYRAVETDQQLRRITRGAIIRLLLGVVIAAIGLGTFLSGVQNGGLIWSGGMLVGVILVGQAIRRLWAALAGRGGRHRRVRQLSVRRMARRNTRLA